MKKLIYLMSLSSLLLVSIGCKDKKERRGLARLTQIDSTDSRGVQRMQPSRSDTSFVFKGRKHHSHVERMPDESLPTVTNTTGDTYADNQILLRLTCEGATWLEKRFTKADFASVVEPEFLQRSILEGLVFDRITPQGIRYAASVCYPRTDLYIPLTLIVSPDGRISLDRVNELEDQEHHTSEQ